MRLTRKQLRRMIVEAHDLTVPWNPRSHIDRKRITPDDGGPPLRDRRVTFGLLDNLTAQIEDMIGETVGDVDLDYSDDPLTKKDILDHVVRLLHEQR